MTGSLVLGLALSGAIAYAGFARGALSPSGAAGAIFVGTLIFWLGGWVWGLVLIAFFVSSSLLSRYREGEKERLAEKFAKGHRRDLGQTLANGGAGVMLAVGSALCPHPLWLAAYVGAMATVNADTWATELGVLSRARPRLITNGRPVDVGTSGGVSGLGTISALVGGAFVGGIAGSLHLAAGGTRTDSLLLLVSGLAGGLAGSFVDSLLGATVQAIYFCDTCGKETERLVHRCGTVTKRLRGWTWLNNDLVNLISSVFGAAAGLALVVWLV
jgi:uncharacterized protein (TIGR00297 family)